MLKSILRTTVDNLDRAGYRKSVATVANAVVGALRRQQHFTVDAQGDWVNRQAEATFVSPNVLFNGFGAKQREILDVWCHQYVPREGDVIVDIGAGIGDEALVFSKIVGPRGRIIAIEAHPRTFHCLEKTVTQSGLSNVEPHLCAISDADGSVVIGDDFADHISNSIVAQNTGGVAVPSFRLDTFLSKVNAGHIALLKMNIEGAERLALQGLVEHLPKIQNFAISCHDFVADRGGSADLRTRADVLAWCQRHGLEVSRRPQDPRAWIKDYVYARWPS